jgi:hypothetical protein
MSKRVETTRKLNVERFEDRQMMAGNILAYMNAAGDLNLLESTATIGQGQAVQVSQLSNGKVRVQGLSSQDGGISQVNGAAYKDFTVPGNVNINLAGGRDTVLVGRNATTLNNLNINTASPSGVNDNDAIYLENLNTRGHLTVTSGAGADFIQSLGTRVGDNYGIDNFAIHSGAGADYINVVNGYGRFTEVNGTMAVNTYDSLSELDADKLYMSGVYARGNVQAFMGSGDDELTGIDLYAGNDVFFATDGGNDKMTMNSVRAYDDIWMLLGEGNDSLNMQYSVADVLTVDGGGGYDSLTTSVPGPVNQLTRTGWEVINGRIQPIYRYPISDIVFAQASF